MNSLLKKLYLGILLLFFQLSAYCQYDCSKIPSKFNSYKIALSTIRSTKFTYTDQLGTGFSSWITKAEYFSCDGKSGYLIVAVREREYIHKNVPIATWAAFKNASSKGSFYNSNIKNRYNLVLSDGN